MKDTETEKTIRSLRQLEQSVLNPPLVIIISTLLLLDHVDTEKLFSSLACGFFLLVVVLS